MQSRLPQVTLAWGQDNRAESLPLNPAASIAATLPLKGQTKLVVESDSHRITLEALEMPGWANGMGRDRAGLFALAGQKTDPRKIRYLPPDPWDTPRLFPDTGKVRERFKQLFLPKCFGMPRI